MPLFNNIDGLNRDEKSDLYMSMIDKVCMLKIRLIIYYGHRTIQQVTPTWKCGLVGSNSQGISLVDVPQRIGSYSREPLTAMDLDVFLWIALPGSRVTTILDVNANQLSVSCFPFNGPDILDGIYTFYFQEQVGLHICYQEIQLY